eukprot:IDg21087t1
MKSATQIISAEPLPPAISPLQHPSATVCDRDAVNMTGLTRVRDDALDSDVRRAAVIFLGATFKLQCRACVGRQD